jgi:mxaA protein
MRRPAQFALLLAGQLAAGSVAGAGIPALELETPRPYGYAIGDVIRHRVSFETEPGQQLDEDSLPKPGPLNRWLELRRVEIAPGPGGRRLELEYQVFYAPLGVRTLRIPGFTLHFTGASGATAAEVPAWPFSMAPIHGLAVLEGGGLEPLRPDAAPEPPGTAAPLARFGGFSLAALISLLYLGHRRGLFAFGRRGRHFRDARRTLRRLGEGGEDPAALRAGFACVHRAFDRTLAEPLFAERLPEFFAGHAGYAGLRGEIEAFFRASYELFFGGGDKSCLKSPHPNPLPKGEGVREADAEASPDEAPRNPERLADLNNPLPPGEGRVREAKKDFFLENLVPLGGIGPHSGEKSRLKSPHPNPVLTGSPARHPAGELRSTQSAPGGLVPEGEGVEDFGLARLEALCLACLRVERNRP